MNLTVKNKLDKPLYLDWKKSALILNDKAISYFSNKINFSAQASGAIVPFVAGPGARSWGYLWGQADLPEGMEFLPPQSFVTKTPLFVSGQALNDLPKGKMQKVEYRLLDGEYEKMNKASFASNESPMIFKSYITFAVGGEGKERKEVVYQHSFYVSEILQARVPPETMDFMSAKKGNCYYVHASH